MCLQSLGKPAAATAIIDSLVTVFKLGQSYWDLPGDMATYYAWVGDVESALRWYGQAARVTPHRILDSGIYDRVRGDRQFRAGMERLRERNRARLREEIRRLRAR